MRLEIKSVLKENWLTQKRDDSKLVPTLILVLAVTTLTLAFWSRTFGLSSLLAASPEQVFNHHEYYRLWTALFVHADAGHLLGNLVLFVPFSYLLWTTYGTFFFPLLGLAAGGLINFFVLQTMSPTHSILGISGVVYWMGTAWITLAYLIDRRESRAKRIVKSLGVFLLLFIPEQYSPEISYLSHALGSALGFVSAVLFFGLREKEFLSAEKFDWKVEIDRTGDEWQLDQIGSEPDEAPEFTPQLTPCSNARCS